MSLSQVCISRPVFTLVLSLTIILFGVISFRELGVREFPQSQRPIITVSTSYPGASAEVIENQITEPLEEEVNTVSGIRTMTSTSREGRSTIRIEFRLGDDLDRAANDVRDRVSAAVQQLPEDAEPPAIEKADAEGDPIVFLTVKSSRRTLLELTEIADNLFKKRLQTIDGVARVDIWGDKEYAMRLWMDQDRLSAYGLTPLDVREALARSNVELPSGRIEGQEVELSVRTLSRLGSDPGVYNDLVLRQEGDRTVRFRDVGHAELGPLNERTILKRDGVPMVGVVLRPQTGANEIEIVDEFYRRVELIKRDLPEDIGLAIGFDTSEFIRESVAEVKQTIFVALALVCLTIFLFLREVRSSLIPLLTIPISLIGTFFIIDMAGFTINVLTLLGLVLAVGLVVDDAVVVLENIYSKIEQGKPPEEAGRQGVHEIFLAVIATTLSLVGVFLPIMFLEGIVGVLFREFGLTLAGAVVISSFVALTLTPMLCTRLLKKHENPGWFYRKTEPWFQRLNESYRRSLVAFLHRRWLALPMLGGCVAIIALFWTTLPQELAPLEDRSLLVLQIQGPQGTNFEYMGSVMDQLEQVVAAEVPGSSNISVTSPGFGASTTVNSGFSRLVLPKPGEREQTQSEIAARLGRAVKRIPGAEIFVRQPPTINTGGGARSLPVEFVIQHQDFAKLREAVPQFLVAARARPEFSFVDVDLKFNRPELQVTFDRDRAQNLGVSASDIAGTVQASLSGQRFGYFLKEGEQYEIIGQVERENRSDPSDLRRLTVRGNDNRIITLDNLVRLTERTSPAVRYRYNRYDAATFSANLEEGQTIGAGIKAMRAVADEVLDDTFATELGGQSAEFAEAGSSLLFVFFFALTLVYLVLAAQFESFRHPFVIMLTVPMAVAGGLFSLWYFSLTLNIFSQIGLIMLIGLVTKNGILIVEFANQRRAAGLDLMEAIESAAAARLRPILMTAISTILGTAPIALALGAGAQSRQPLGIAVVGGMVIGTVLSLYLIPACYALFSGGKSSKRGPANVNDSVLEGEPATH